MRFCIFRLALLLCLLVLAIKAADETVKITFFTQYEEEQQEDYIEIQLELEAQQKTLTAAIASAKKTAKEIADESIDYCKQNKKGKVDCKEAAEVSEFEIEPKYTVHRKVSTFDSFLVKHDITLKVFNVDKIGNLADSIKRHDEITLKGFEWKPQEQKDSEEAAIKQGMQQGQGLCKQIDMTLGQILKVEEIIEQKPEKKQEQEEEEQEPQVTVYKFEIECVKKAKSKKQK